MNKELAKRLIKQVVFIYGAYIKNLTGIEVNAKAEEKRLYNMFLGGQITIQNIRDDIKEYQKMNRNLTE